MMYVPSWRDVVLCVHVYIHSLELTSRKYILLLVDLPNGLSNTHFTICLSSTSSRSSASQFCAWNFQRGRRNHWGRNKQRVNIPSTSVFYIALLFFFRFAQSAWATPTECRQRRSANTTKSARRWAATRRSLFPFVCAL